jgi:hypothetical protein
MMNRILHLCGLLLNCSNYSTCLIQFVNRGFILRKWLLKFIEICKD